MLQPPSLKSAPRFPVTVSVAAAATVVTGLGWTAPHAVQGAQMDLHVWDNWQVWRGLTSTLPHVNPFHLAFNLYWWWVFGTLLERLYGHLRFVGIVALLALSSSLAEFAVMQGGAGLSGV